MQKVIPRDISWLAFNGRVLQEAADPSVPLNERIKFLGIFSNNRDEFFRVRIASLKRMLRIESKLHMHPEKNPKKILEQIHGLMDTQQEEFEHVWKNVQRSLNRNKIYLKNATQLTLVQKKFIREFYETEISTNIIPLMIENIKKFPNLRDKSIFLGIVMRKSYNRQDKKFAIIEVPVTAVGRFIELPSKSGQHDIMLLEEAIIFNLPDIFKFLGYDEFHANIFKFTRDAELDIDTADDTTLIQKLETGLKNRKKGTPVRFTYDEKMDPELLHYLVTRMGFDKQDAISPASAIHNFRHFIDFPAKVFKNVSRRKEPFDHPLLLEQRISDVIMHRDVLLSFPYHNFTPIIDLIREAAFDPEVHSIKITCYRVASQSKIINALINAVRNGKEVTVMLELRARFDEEANMEWKQRLEDVGATVLTGFQNMKVHGKMCIIKKRRGNKTINYGFISTGNLNEKTAKVYADHCLLTANKKIMADINRIFSFLEKPKLNEPVLAKCTTVIPSPTYIRTFLLKQIDQEIASARKKKKAEMIIKMNSLSDIEMIQKLYEAARSGVVVKLIVRGIFCMLSQNKKFKHKVTAISIVDEYLEHARVFVFHNNGKPKVFISSADWMIRNLEHRVEATCPVTDPKLKSELIDILNIQLSDNVKARVLDNELKNKYVQSASKKLRSQEAIYNYLFNKKYS
ncbi:MAG TPA: polyphosphate kinase 1 [Niabella sp.]